MAVPSWLWEDLGNYFGAGASALSFHENYYSVSLKPGKKVGDKTSVLLFDPPQKGLSFHNETTTGPEGSGDLSCIYGSEFSPLQYIRGKIPLGIDQFVVKGAIPDPANILRNARRKNPKRRHWDWRKRAFLRCAASCHPYNPIANGQRDRILDQSREHQHLR